MKDGFWTHLERLLKESQFVIDRPKDSKHPHFSEASYPLDYGYLEGTSSADGGGIDVWLGSQESFDLTGIACTFDTLKKDAEIKLLAGCSQEDIQKILKFYELRMKIMIIMNPEKGATR